MCEIRLDVIKSNESVPYMVMFQMCQAIINKINFFYLFFFRHLSTQNDSTYLHYLNSMWTKARHLNHSQKQRITNNLFVAVAVGAVLTVAGPTLLPCPAYDQNDRSAFLEQEESTHTKKKVVIVKKKRKDTTQQV
ncbi:uncharacterized protein B0P05DRAFT_222461 [Gilbertella persicaria]|nr:uncharacterized protein B0P05DRAFT_222461 [Gilbertella persicaria]KAI8092270.1 hypothetical protein B0P05DRAFT_222461 [Gilbertella persicaria]